MSVKKPEPIYFPPKQRLCPVCGKASYSQSGEHPQCALVRADDVTRARIKKRNARREKPAA